MKLPSFTKTYRQDTYPAIDPTRPEVSAKDKTVIVTGAGIGGIGSEVALSFAKAGAPNIALIGRTGKTLEETRTAVVSACPETNVFIAVADVSKAESIGRAAHDIRAALGAWDIFANFAAVLPPASTIAGADEDAWWQAFEITVRFPFHFAKHFMPKARPNATFINVNAGASHIPAARMPKNSAYSAAKLAAAKLDDYLAAEHPTLRVFTVHPGVVDTPLFRHAIAGVAEKDLPKGAVLDKVALPAHFTVWLASAEAEFLRGRYIWVNWDVEELIDRREEIQADPSLFKIILGGWPFQ
ncbi:uncharacterized protein A1O9_00652 [Exophiala aquamarina CBS 119918]|uniref:NAD(P)-binding protein n=1 Tax=Exophiala aquamarina CBS 119918 TaxID=1182545 RepID=A0A072PRE9_9EURO|nr:uncharacterized protein A1O9_00652 [Exophiala aquamarina CBS 119918]KEF62679.1 hypothetical protein A1O9_00652 [Exophiala aquamarina CBS 119918]